MDAPIKEQPETFADEDVGLEMRREAVVLEAARREVIRAQAKRSRQPVGPVVREVHPKEAHPPADASRARPEAHSGRRATFMMAAAILVFAGLGAILGAVGAGGGGAPSAAQLSKASAPVPDAPKRALPASNAALMGIVQLHGEGAPGFSLVDQGGIRVSLSQLDAKRAVVLSFMDDRGSDVAPVIAKELVAASSDLKALLTQVDFVAINLNAAHGGPRFLEEFVVAQGLQHLRFTYLTGSARALRTVWADYGIGVQAGAPNGAISHGEAMYFISPGGAIKFEATPYADMGANGVGSLPPSTVSQWGNGIAEYARAALGEPA